MKTASMIDLAQLDDLARRLSNLVPPGLREGREELQQNFKSVLQAGLGKLDLVTRDRSLSAQFEHSIGITADGCEIFTLSPAGYTCPPYPAGGDK